MKMPGKTSLYYFVFNSVGVAAMDTLATGSLLASYAVFLNASTLEISFLAVAPFIANLMNFAGVYRAQNGASIKNNTFLFSLVSRPFYLLIAALAFLPDLRHRSLILCILIFLCYAVGAVSTGTFYPWLKASLKENEVLKFVHHKYFFPNAVQILLMCALAIFWKKLIPAHYIPEHAAFALLYLLAFLFGTLSSLCFVPIPDKKILIDKGSCFLTAINLNILKKYNSLLVICFVGMWMSLAFYSFMPLVILKVLNYSVSDLFIYTLIHQVCFVGSVKMWEILTQKKGLLCAYPLNTGLGILLGLFLTAMLLLGKTAGGAWLFIFCVFQGVFQSGNKFLTEAVLLLKAPAKNSPVFFMFVFVCRLLASLCIVITGGIINYFSEFILLNKYILFGILFAGSIGYLKWLKTNLKKF